MSVRVRFARAMAAVMLLIGSVVATPVQAATPTNGAITWTVDHKAKTITVLIHLEIYSGCSEDPAGDNPRACVGVRSQVTRFQAQKIQDAIEKFWNKDHYYRCYKLIVHVDVSLGTARSKVSNFKFAVRLDPTFTSIRSYVDNSGNSSGADDWQSNGPSARNETTNNGAHETTWAEVPSWDLTYAHETGHLMGLDDTYKDLKDAKGNVIGSQPKPGAPRDIMSGYGGLSQETMDRLVERNSDRLVDTKGNKVELSDLKCDYRLKIKILMQGVNPAFLGLVKASGEVDLKPLLGAMPQGTQPIVYTGVGTVTYNVTPIGHRGCTFGYEGSGSFTVGVRTELKFPLKKEELVVTIAPRLQPLQRDTLIAWPCGGKGRRQKVIPLFTGFYTDRLGKDWNITDWAATTSFDKADKFDGFYDGRCARNLCREGDDFVLSEIENSP